MNVCTGKVAVITGAARGIGYAAATELAKCGFSVGLVDRLAQDLETAASAIKDAGGDVLVLDGDVADFNSTQELGAKILDRWGRVDVLVNNAGRSQPRDIIELTEDEWDETININLKGCFNWCKAVVPTMLEQQSGRIINMSSISAKSGGGRGGVSRFAYCAAKAGVLGLTRGLARDLAPHISVNAICPGAIETIMTAALIAERRSKMLENIPLNRIGTPEDIAQVIVFLATVSPNYMTGETLDIDGGMCIN